MLNILAIVGVSLCSVLKSRQTLILENLALRHQLTVLRRSAKRPRLGAWDRLLWLLLRQIWIEWRSALVLVQPATVIRWHRGSFRRYWSWRSRRRPGRPGLDPEMLALIHRIATANPLWGAPRIHGELLKLGIEVSERTVSRHLPKSPKAPSQTWRTFLANHIGDLIAIDFFTVPTVRCQVLFCFLVLSPDRRRVLHFNVTEHPTSEWTAQQIIEALPWDTAPRYLLRDRDRVYGGEFRERIRGMEIMEVLTTVGAPWQNPYVERLIGSIRRECLDHVIVRSARHLRQILTEYLEYYHRTRTHLSLGKDAPHSRLTQHVSDGRIIELPAVGGLHHRYERRAA